MNNKAQCHDRRFSIVWFNKIALMLLLGLSSGVHADADGERVALAKLIHELEALEPLIIQARSQADSDARVLFQYDWLMLDIERIRLGIREHLIAPRTQPRSFPPLKGDYRF